MAQLSACLSLGLNNEAKISFSSLDVNKHCNEALLIFIPLFLASFFMSWHKGKYFSNTHTKEDGILFSTARSVTSFKNSSLCPHKFTHSLLVGLWLLAHVWIKKFFHRCQKNEISFLLWLLHRSLSEGNNCGWVYNSMMQFSSLFRARAREKMIFCIFNECLAVK